VAVKLSSVDPFAVTKRLEPLLYTVLKIALILLCVGGASRPHKPVNNVVTVE